VYDRDRVVASVDLGALADELLGPRRGTTASGCWSCPSPQHAQTGKTPPVTIFRSRGGEQRWHCHGCGIGGSAIDLVMAARGLGVGEAMAALAGRGGLREEDRRVGPPPRSVARPVAPPAAEPGDLAGLQCFVDECAERLWRPEGRQVLRWLTEVRGLPEGVLRLNRIGADPGRRHQWRPDGIPSGGPAAVLPVVEDGRATFAQLRSIRPPPDRPRYLNASSHLAPNPRIGLYEPVAAVGRAVIVTEGVIDALSANAAGFRSAAVLGASLAGSRSAKVGKRLARLGRPLVLAFDADDAGRRAAEGLRGQLRELGVATALVKMPGVTGDLNGWMTGGADLTRVLGSGAGAVARSPGGPCCARRGIR